jgi:uncharacterized protein
MIYIFWKQYYSLQIILTSNILDCYYFNKVEKIMAKTKPQLRPLALITGATSGIGKEICRELARRQFDCLLVARRGDKLYELKVELEKNFEINVTLYEADLTVAQERQAIYDFVNLTELKPDILVNNAGSGLFEQALRSEESASRKLHELNVVAVVEFCEHFLPAMIEEGNGYIMNLGSVSSILPIPGFARYAAGKHYLLGFGMALRQEVKEHGVSITTVCPGLVDTEFFEQEAFKNSVARIKSTRKMSSPEDIARKAVDAMFSRKAILVLPLRSRLKCYLYSIAPISLKDKLLLKTWQRVKNYYQL